MKQAKRYSVADARNQLASIVHRVERGAPVEITRRGAPVAVLLSLAEYQRLTTPQGDLLDALEQFRSTADLDALHVDEVFRDTRDRSPGRVACARARSA